MSSFSHRFLPTIKALQVQNWGLAHLLAFIIRFAKINTPGIPVPPMENVFFFACVIEIPGEESESP